MKFAAQNELDARRLLMTLLGLQTQTLEGFDPTSTAGDIFGALNAAGNVATGAGGLITALKLSDRRLKSNVVRIGTHPLGIGIYRYDIFGSTEIGVMADEVLTVKPEAVPVHPSGYLMVDYSIIYGMQ